MNTISIEGKKVLVVGTGVSGIAAAGLLLKENTDVVLYDGNDKLDTETFYEKAPELKSVPLILGELTNRYSN